MPTFVEIRQKVDIRQGRDLVSRWARTICDCPDHMRILTRLECELLNSCPVNGWARLAGYGDLPLIDGKRPFYRVPGKIMRTLLLEAKDRGAAQGIEIGGFTASADSSGKSWGKVATIYYQPGLPILCVLENLVEQGMCDYRMEGNTVLLFEPETTIGQDLATGDNPVRVHGLGHRGAHRVHPRRTHEIALLIGDDGFKSRSRQPVRPDDYGRLEVTIEQGGVTKMARPE